MCVGEEESLVFTVLLFKQDPRYSSGSGFHRTLSYHARMDDPVKSALKVRVVIAGSKTIMLSLKL